MKDRILQRITMQLRTRTPLWTGGINGMDCIHESGIIGSLRWWYETIVRGSGHYACDPASHKDERECPVCSLFGHTGQKRKFSLSIESKSKPVWDSSNLNIRPYDRTRGWFLPPGFTGTMEIELHGQNREITRIASLIQWLSQWGTIGAKSQLGYGVFEVSESSAVIESINLDMNGIEENQPSELPDLRTFTFFKFHFIPHDERWWRTIRDYQYMMKNKENAGILENLAKESMLPVSPLLKNYFRYKKEWKSFGIPKWLFGTVEGDKRQKSRVSFSWAYRVEDHWEVRGWAWLPYGIKSRYFYHDAVRGLKNVVEDETEWLKALDLQGKVSEAKVYIEPGKSPWGVKDTDTVMRWLKEE